jgi:hypothetical protein
MTWRQARLARARLASGEDMSGPERRRLRWQIRLRDKATVAGEPDASHWP